jgi:release factor glutamine methyltransferase
MTPLDKMKQIAALFERNSIEDPVKEAEMLVAGLLRIDRAALYTQDSDFEEDKARRLDDLAVRRTRGEPLQYLIGTVPFFGLNIYVGSGVLIPRPETELLVEEAIKMLGDATLHGHLRAREGDGGMSILDLCTGSGCIALSLARHFPQAIVYGVDDSEAAMVYATQNALENGIANVRFRLGDLFEPVKRILFDCIVSNPPYVRHDEIETLQREIREHEPISALDGGRDGLDFYRRILRDAPAHLKENGMIMLEIGFGQSSAVCELAQHAGFTQLRFIKDFAGIKRVMTGVRKK